MRIECKIHISLKWIETFQFAQMMQFSVCVETKTERKTKYDVTRLKAAWAEEECIGCLILHTLIFKLSSSYGFHRLGTVLCAVALAACSCDGTLTDAHIQSDPLSLCTTHYIYYYCQYMWNDVIANRNGLAKRHEPKCDHSLARVHVRAVRLN